MKSTTTGFTLVEVLIVVSIMGIAALVLIPGTSSTQPVQLEVAAQEIADAFEFARSESIRTRREHGVIINSSLLSARVFSADTSTTPPTLTYDVHHPLSKKIYDIQLRDHSFARIHSITQTYTTHGNCTTPRTIIFNIYGNAFCGNPYDSLFTTNEFELSLNNASRRISIDGTTGRVLVR